MLYFLKNKYITLTVDSFGASMHSIIFLGEERLWQGGDAWNSRDVVIFPVVGHAYPYTAEGKEYNPKSHGVARYSEFALVENSLDTLILELSSNAVTKQTYPYYFVLSIKYTLKKNTVKITYTVKSKQGEIPFYIGGHAGMKAPDGEAIVEFENEEEPIAYFVDTNEAMCLAEVRTLELNKDMFRKHKTIQFGDLSGGALKARVKDGFVYTYKSDCPLYAFWSNENDGDFICIEPWWGINDYPQAPKELKDKRFMNFANENGKSFSYSLSITKE